MGKSNKNSYIKLISALIFIGSLFLIFFFSNTPETLGQDEGFSFLPNNNTNNPGFNLSNIFNLGTNNDRYTLGPDQTQNQGSAVQTNSVSDTSSLDQLINQQNQKDAEALRKAQEQDRQECRAEAGMAPGGVLDGNTTAINPGTGGWGSGANPLGGSNNGIPSVGAGNEQEVRQALEEAGVNVENESCGSETVQILSGACTNVANLPQSTVDNLDRLTDEVGQVTLINSNLNGTVDIKKNPDLDRYVSENTVGVYQDSEGTWYLLKNGDKYLDKGDYWHVVFSDKTNILDTSYDPTYFNNNNTSSNNTSVKSCEIPYSNIISNIKSGLHTKITEVNFRGWASIDNLDYTKNNPNGSGDKRDLEKTIIDYQMCSAYSNFTTAETADYQLLNAKKYIDKYQPLVLSFALTDKKFYTTYPPSLNSLKAHVVILLDVNRQIIRDTNQVESNLWTLKFLDSDGPNVYNMSCRKQVVPDIGNNWVAYVCDGGSRIGKVVITNVRTFDSLISKYNSYCGANASSKFCNERKKMTLWLENNYPYISNFADSSNIETSTGVCSGWSNFILEVAYLGEFVGYDWRNSDKVGQNCSQNYSPL